MRLFFSYFYPPQGDKGDRGDRGLTTTIKGDEFPTGIIEGPPGPPGPPGKCLCNLSVAAAPAPCHCSVPLQSVFVCLRLRQPLNSRPALECIKQIQLQMEIHVQ